MKNLIRSSALILTISATTFLVGCAQKTYDYTQFKQHRPRSLLVLPPVNEGTDIRASYSYLSTVTKPLAEMGYYVFPVALVDQMMKQNGLPTPGDMHQAPLKKIAEVLNPDAVLYITLKQYGSSYKVVNSSTAVVAKARLVDTKTGTLLWEGEGRADEDSASGSSGSIVGLLVGAAVSQAVNSGTDRAHDLCSAANEAMFERPGSGLLVGPRHPEFSK